MPTCACHVPSEDKDEQSDEVQRYEREVAKEPVITMDQVYAKETGRSQQVDRQAFMLQTQIASTTSDAMLTRNDMGSSDM
eukprot:s2306_g8.t1